MKTSLSITRRKQMAIGARKSQRLRRKCCLRREYKKLRSLLPPTAKTTTDLRHKVGVVDAAYQYIRQLQSALLDKFSSRGIPPDLANIVGNKVTSAEDVQALALYLIRQNSSNNNTNSTTTINGDHGNNKNLVLSMTDLTNEAQDSSGESTDSGEPTFASLGATSHPKSPS